MTKKRGAQFFPDLANAVHGKATTYNMGCRCEPCMVAKAGVRKRMTMSSPPAPFYHGTERGYSMGRCRCEECREAYRAYMRKLSKNILKNAKPEDHGTANMYDMGCRCRLCGQARYTSRTGRSKTSRNTKYFPDANPIEHGTHLSYGRGCRCILCTAGQTAHITEYKKKRLASGEMPKQHGTASTYKNWGCRCPACRVAGAIENKRAREAWKKREAKS
jgi:hypothetical protein